MAVNLSSLNHLGKEDLAHFLFFGMLVSIWLEGREATVFVSVIYYQLAMFFAWTICGVANVAHHLPRKLRNADVTAFREVLTVVQGYHVAFALNLEMIAINLLLPNTH